MNVPINRKIHQDLNCADDPMLLLSLYRVHVGWASKYTYVPTYLQGESMQQTVRALLHCKCLQGITGTLQGNRSAGISNLWGLHVYLQSL